MTTIFQQSQYAEDMPMSTAYGILTSHVLMRGFATTGFVGAVLPLVASPLRTWLGRPSPLPLLSRVFRGAAVGGVGGTVFCAVSLGALMYGQPQIGWQDRSWRLRENQAQIAGDYGILAGGAAGAALSASGWQRDALSRVVQGVSTRLAGRWIRPVGLSGLGAGLGMFVAAGLFAARSQNPSEVVQKEVQEMGNGMKASAGLQAS